MELSEKQLKQLKETELEMFKCFISICEKLKLRYYLVEGTLLGAVRHKGFIPWDDDIDVGMPRKDYEIFLEKGKEFLPEEYFVQSINTEPNYAANFAKIRNSKTTFIETTVRDFEINHGIYIDIFPLDYYPADAKMQKKINKKKKMLTARITSAFYLPDAKMSFKTKILKAILALKYPSYQSAVKAREKLYSSVTDGEVITNYCSAWGSRENVPAEWYGEGCFVEFEGIKARVPSEYDKWLTNVYGDYMTLPPVEKRVTHHYVDVVDFEKSYTEYTKKGRI